MRYPAGGYPPASWILVIRLDSESDNAGERKPHSQTACRVFLCLLRTNELVALLEDAVDRLGGAGVQTEAAAFQTAGRIELVGRRREPGAGRTDGNAHALMCAAVRMADEVVTDDHHRFHSFEETLREDLEHIFLG